MCLLCLSSKLNFLTCEFFRYSITLGNTVNFISFSCPNSQDYEYYLVVLTPSYSSSNLWQNGRLNVLLFEISQHFPMQSPFLPLIFSEVRIPTDIWHLFTSLIAIKNHALDITCIDMWDSTTKRKRQCL